MSYVNDPWEKALSPQLENTTEELLQEPRDYHEFFFDDLPPEGNNFAVYTHGLHTQVCRFVDGKHITIAKDCPHFDETDEMGRRIREGWVAQ